MNKEHNYKLTVEWTGNKGTGTSNYKEFERSYKINNDRRSFLNL